MLFEWNEHKRRVNRRKHGLDFADCERIFEGPLLSSEDNRFDYGEQRFFTIGLLGERIVAIGHTVTDDLIRVITMRRASRYEKAIFFQSLEK